MSFASPASLLAALAVERAVLSPVARILMVAFISACVHAFPSAILAAQLIASAIVLTVFLAAI
jgi:hypothetical protein